MHRNRVVITGGSGFIGTNAVSYFLDHGYEVLSIDIRAPVMERNKSVHCELDILDYKKLLRTVVDFGPTYLIHLAARTDLDGISVDDYEVNTIGVKNIVNVCKSIALLDRVIFASSRLVCEIGYQPVNDQDTNASTCYGLSKVEGEKIVRDANLSCSWCIVRPTSIWGPWFGVPYNLFFNLIKRGLYFHPRKKIISKSFGFVGNTIYQLEKILFANKTLIDNKTFYLCDYPPIDVYSWSSLVAKKMSCNKPIQIPFLLLKIIALTGDIFKSSGIIKHPPLTSFRLNNLCSKMIYDTALLEEVCGDLPFNEEQGVDITVKWINENK